MSSPILQLLFCQFKHEINRETLNIPPYSSFQLSSFHPIKLSQISVHQDLFAPQQVYFIRIFSTGTMFVIP